MLQPAGISDAFCYEPKGQSQKATYGMIPLLGRFPDSMTASGGLGLPSTGGSTEAMQGADSPMWPWGVGTAVMVAIVKPTEQSTKSKRYCV